jgi:hypothetical protein
MEAVTNQQKPSFPFFKFGSLWLALVKTELNKLISDLFHTFVRHISNLIAVEC